MKKINSALIIVTIVLASGCSLTTSESGLIGKNQIQSNHPHDEQLLG